MKTKLLIPILFLVLLAGCRTTKETLKTKVDTKTEATVKAKTSVDSTVNTVDHSAAVTLTDEVITVAELSKPDSSGKQYTTKVTTIIRKQNASVKTNVSKETRVKSDSDYKSDLKQKTAVKQTATKTEQTKTPLWVYFGVLVLVLVIGIYIAFKRVLK